MRILSPQSALWYGVVILQVASTRTAKALSVINGPSYSPTIAWEPCPDASSFQCASFTVPLDYAHPEVGNATLAVVRMKASKSPQLGTIFTNPGGPGLSGLQFLIGRAGQVISTITDGQYDIVSWDPRGVGQSSPQISCGFTSTADYDAFLGDSMPLAGFEARGNFTDQNDIRDYFDDVEATDAILLQMGKRCLETDGSFLKYMGTVAVVRDMLALSDSLVGADQKVNYWGFSYGTVIGNYFVNMFPDRVGRVVFDGVIDSIIWATEPSFKIIPGTLISSESALEGFAASCSQSGPANCTISVTPSTATSILENINNLINTVYDLNKANRSNGVTSFDVRSFIGFQMETPLSWSTELIPQLDAWFAMFGGSDNTTTGQGKAARPRGIVDGPHHQPRSIVGPVVQTILSNMVISCVDTIDQESVTTKDVLEEVLRVTQDISPTFGEISLVTGQMFCHRFPVRAVERFTGPFNQALASPIIVIGNAVDPIAPLSNAQKIAKLLGQSARLVEQNAIGHTSLSENSECTQAIVRDYFLNGNLPPADVVCATDQALFPPNATLVSLNPADI